MKNILVKYFKGNKVPGKQVDSEEKNESNEKYELADFETAISATGFGKFNVILMLIAIPTGWASMMESSSMSYVVPIAHCDLELSLEMKGYLISITYLGMIVSAMVWGFLSDTLGRKKLLVIGLLADAFFTFMAAFSQSFGTLLFAKFMGGLIINGPFAVLTTVLSEFHCAKYRARVVISMGIIFSIANITLPLVAWAILPLRIDWTFGGTFVLHSWNMFLMATALPSLVSGLCHILLPESPKFLMTAGRNAEALAVFRKVYSMNTGMPPHTYPIKGLIDETHQDGEQKKRSSLQAFTEGFKQIKPLFCRPHLVWIILVCMMQVGSLMGLNTLRLWLPSIFTAINDYRASHNNNDASMCVMLGEVRPNATISDDYICTVNTDNGSVYLNVLYAGAASLVGYLFVSSLINLLGKKPLLVILGCIAGTCGFCVYFAEDSIVAIVLSSIFIALSGINTNVILAIIVDLFPTSLRTMAVAISMMMGRGGAMMGNILFPHLISAGCIPPFLFIGLSTIMCAILGMLLPKTDLKALE